MVFYEDDNKGKYNYVPDTSVIINGQFLKYLKKQENIDSIILSRVVLAEIEHQANQARAQQQQWAQVGSLGGKLYEKGPEIFDLSKSIFG